MDNNTYLDSNLLYVYNISAAVGGSPQLAIGFLLGFSLLGLATFICVFWAQRHRLKDFKDSIILSLSCRHATFSGVETLHSSFITLLFVDVLNAITTVILVMEFAAPRDHLPSTAVYVFITWFLLRCFGMIFHLVNALLCVFILYHPQYGAKLRWFFAGIVLLILVLVPFYVLINKVAVILMAVTILVLTLAIIPKRTSLATTHSAAAALKGPIVIVALVTFLIVYFPSFVFQCVWYGSMDSGEPKDIYRTLFLNVALYTNVHLIMDGLQGFYILKIPTGEQER